MFETLYYIIGNDIGIREVAVLYLIISFVILILDLFTKYIVQKNLVPYESIPVIDNIFHITYVQNTGAAFSILKGKTLFFAVVSLIIVAIIALILFKFPIKQRILGNGLAMILGGALGNLIDRLRFGYVVDFLDFRVWPVFNIADCLIVVGVIILAYIIMFHPDNQTMGSKNRR